MEEAIERRMEEELGITSTLEFVYKFSYEARYKDLGSENENCSVFLGRSEQTIRANRSEIAECRFITPKDLLAELSTSSDKFTPWIRMEWQKLEEEFPDRLARYASASG